LAYSWPGNVRELRNVLERALILSDGRLIKPEHVPLPPDAPSVTPLTLVVDREFPSHGVDLEARERELVERALRHAGQNKSKAARLLGLTRTKLYTRMQRFGWRRLSRSSAQLSAPLTPRCSRRPGRGAPSLEATALGILGARQGCGTPRAKDGATSEPLRNSPAWPCKSL